VNTFEMKILRALKNGQKVSYLLAIGHELGHEHEFENEFRQITDMSMNIVMDTNTDTVHELKDIRLWTIAAKVLKSYWRNALFSAGHVSSHK
jgi:hypothetical protein